MSAILPTVSAHWLYDPAQGGAAIRLDTPAWVAWLDAPTSTRFAYPVFDATCGYIVGRLTVRKEQAQRGALLVCGDAGDALGDSLYEARLYVRGSVAALGADCIEKQMGDEHLAQVGELLQRAGIDDVAPAEFRRYGSARRLYNFKIENVGAY